MGIPFTHGFFKPLALSKPMGNLQGTKVVVSMIFQKAENCESIPNMRRLDFKDVAPRKRKGRASRTVSKCVIV